MSNLSKQFVMDAVDSNFFSTSARQSYGALKAQLWSAIDSEINLAECDIYRQVLSYTFSKALNAGCLHARLSETLSWLQSAEHTVRNTHSAWL